jgi:hypothetical protein
MASGTHQALLAGVKLVKTTHTTPRRGFLKNRPASPVKNARFEEAVVRRAQAAVKDGA